MVALSTTTTFIVLTVWNNQLHQPPFCHSSSISIKIIKKQIDKYNKLLYILIFSE